jgi:hypothetical protein
MSLILVDVEGGPNGGACAGEGKMGEFGAVLFDAPPFLTRFHGENDSKETMLAFDEWLTPLAPVIFVSDNPAYDWQHINWAFWNRLRKNPFGHSARRISDFYAGLKRDWRATQDWKKYRITPHDHNPVHDSLGNAEALWTIFKTHDVKGV